jgi:transposase-like protein
LSVAECAAQVGVSSWTLYQWRRRLAAPGNASGLPPRLIEVAISREESSPEAEGLTLHLDRGGRSVTVPRGFDTDDLRRLIGVLESC